MKKLILLAITFCLFCFSGIGQTNRIVTNPINLNYRFQYDAPSYREAADPVCEYYKGKYYLFASKSGGYWSSTDLAEWTFISCSSIAELDRYAPTIMIIGDWMYLTTANANNIYRTNNPDAGNSWAQVTTQCSIPNDPAFFVDDDGRVYLYGGCSDNDPIKGFEIDPNNNFKRIGTEKSLIGHHPDRYGWERQGNNNTGGTGWNEGPCMNKYKGKYYLQYASPGTQYRTYADGVYVSDNPLGPFTYQEYSPYSIKTGGFIGGAGHGHTFQDKYGNYWHLATMSISQRHSFERRIALFPAYFDENDQLYARTEKGDYPFSIPDAKVDFQTDDRSMPWNLLSFRKTATASSTLDTYSANNANDETVETRWSAATGNVGEYWQVDLGKKMTVNAIHINFADQDFTIQASPPGTGVNIPFIYLYSIEMSDTGNSWTMLVDKTANTNGTVHDLIVLDTPVETRYLRINNAKALAGKFSLFDFRVFGTSAGELPDEVTGIRVQRETDQRRFQIQWNEQENVTGYIVRWGTQPDKLNHSTVVYTNHIASELGDIAIKTYCPSGTNVTTSGPPVKINGDIIEYMNGHTGAFFEYANVEGGAGGLSEICLKYSKGWDQITRMCLSVNDDEPFYVDFPGTDWNWNLYKEVCLTVMLNAGATNKIRFTVCDNKEGINGACLTVKYPAGDDDTYEFEAGYFNADLPSYYFAIDAFNENGITRGTSITEGGQTVVASTNKEKTVTFYPNPASDHLTFYAPEEATLLIYDLSGRLMGQYELKQGDTTISVANYPIGEYLFEVRMANGYEMGKWVKK